MIDYKKLKIAHELAENLFCSERISICIDFDREYKSICYVAKNMEGIIFCGEYIDDLIAKLQELTQPKPKYKINQVVWYLDLPINVIHCAKIIKIRHGEYVLNGSSNGTKDDFIEDELYPTKQDLIEAQIEYWQTLRDHPEDNLEKVGFQHESDGNLYHVELYPPFSSSERTKCKKCGVFYR